MRHRRAFLENNKPSQQENIKKKIKSVRNLIEQAVATTDLERTIADVREVLREFGIRNPQFNELRDKVVFEFTTSGDSWKLQLIELRGREYMLELKNKDKGEVENRPTNKDSIKSNVRFLFNEFNIR